MSVSYTDYGKGEDRERYFHIDVVDRNKSAYQHYLHILPQFKEICKPIYDLGVDDFLYLKEQLWGQPNYEQLKFFMKDAWEKRLRYMDHTYTKHLVSGDSVMACLLQNLPQSDVAL